MAKSELDDEVKRVASELKKEWQGLVANAKSSKPAAKSEDQAGTSGAATVKTEVKAEVKAEAMAVEPDVKSAAASSSMDIKPKPGGADSSAGGASTKILQKTGDSTRDTVRTMLHKAFEKGKKDNDRFLAEFNCDTVEMAEEAEAHMVSVYGSASTKEYKARYRSLAFNLQDPKNPTFLMRVVTGQVVAKDLAVMEVKEMASDEMKKQRQESLEHAKMALMDDRTYRNYAGKNTQDGILKCPRCKSMKTEYVEVQTRSADEPTTKKCSCNDCDYRWKFC